MPRRPDGSQHTPDARFDAYRERVGRLYRNEAGVGPLLVRVAIRATAVSGHFLLSGETLPVRWTTSEESSRLRHAAFAADDWL